MNDAPNFGRQPEYEFHYTKFAALRAYIDRIGAEQLNFKRFRVRKPIPGTKYSEEVAIIKIVTKPELSLTCTNEQYAPTDAEEAAIKQELASVEFPKSIHATDYQVKQLIASGQIRGKLFSFYDLARRVVIMCEERIEHEDGDKTFLPWTFFAAGANEFWRMMEPDGPLPFWKPEVDRQRANIMVHEGAHAAAYIDDLVNNPARAEERKNHPWIEDLRDYEHWGTRGSESVFRLDYDELRHTEQVKIGGDVVYSADCDAPGQSAVPKFSRQFSHVMFWIRYDNRFRAGWDMANPVPEAAGKDSFKHMILPATWATVPVPKAKGETGRLGHALNPHFRGQWLHSIDPVRFHHARLPLRSLSADAFDAMVRPFSDVDETSRLVKRELMDQAVRERYNPSRESGLFVDNNISYINLYIPSPIRPYPEAEKRALRRTNYDVPFTEFLNKLVPSDDERAKLAKWVATLLAIRGVKLRYAVLLVSETQGVGKTTLCEIIATVLGNENSTPVSASDLVGSDYQYWAENQFVYISEILDVHAPKFYDKTKEKISDDYIDVHKKYYAPYKARNYVNFMGCSNSLRALLIPDEDRRWLAVWASEQTQPKEYWVGFRDWLKNQDGYRKVRLWAEDYIKQHGTVGDGEHAPDTDAKNVIKLEGLSRANKFIRKLFTWLSETRANGRDETYVEGATGRSERERLLKLMEAKVEFIILDQEGVTVIDEVLYEGHPPANAASPHMVRKAAKAVGYHIGKHRVTRVGWVRGHYSRIITTCAPLALMHPDALADIALSLKKGDRFMVSLPNSQEVEVEVLGLATLAHELKAL